MSHADAPGNGFRARRASGASLVVCDLRRRIEQGGFGDLRLHDRAWFSGSLYGAGQWCPEAALIALAATAPRARGQHRPPRSSSSIGAVADIVQCGLPPQHIEADWLKTSHSGSLIKCLILLDLLAWLAALDGFRPWLIREAA